MIFLDNRSLEQINRIYRRYNFTSNDISYIVHTNQRTYFYLTDSRKIMSTMPLKAVLSCLPALDFWSIQKGIVVSVHHVTDISDQFLYTMDDGTTFQGRSRNPAEHKRRRRLLTASAPSSVPLTGRSCSLRQQCSIMDQAPLAFSVIELIFSDDGRGIDFLFRYCNQEMARLEGTAIEDMLDHSFYEVFPNAERKWIVPYADVAINGTSRVIHKLKADSSEKLCIHCFQPMPGFCACLISKE